MLFGGGVAGASDFQGHAVGVLFWRAATKHLARA